MCWEWDDDRSQNNTVPWKKHTHTRKVTVANSVTGLGKSTFTITSAKLPIPRYNSFIKIYVQSISLKSWHSTSQPDNFVPFQTQKTSAYISQEQQQNNNNNKTLDNELLSSRARRNRTHYHNNMMFVTHHVDLLLSKPSLKKKTTPKQQHSLGIKSTNN